MMMNEFPILIYITILCSVANDHNRLFVASCRGNEIDVLKRKKNTLNVTYLEKIQPLDKMYRSKYNYLELILGKMYSVFQTKAACKVLP